METTSKARSKSTASGSEVMAGGEKAGFRRRTTLESAHRSDDGEPREIYIPPQSLVHVRILQYLDREVGVSPW